MAIIELNVKTMRERTDQKCGKKIVEAYNDFKISVKIDYIDSLPDWTVYHLTLTDGATLDQVYKYARDVQSRLGIRRFEPITYGLKPCIAIADHEVKYPGLLEILINQKYRKQLAKAQLPHIVGFGVTSRPTIYDLAEYPHILLGGETNSGKSVGLQTLITTIVYTETPAEVNFILIDLGCNDLGFFGGLPHLCCPIIRTKESAYRALAVLCAEMNRRVNLEETDPKAFAKLPRLVLVFDEFASVFSELDKDKRRLLTDRISAILQRGRHAKIHVVAAAHNPTLANIKVDTSNFTARLAFRCARENVSKTILGEKGAERLLGKGDLLFRSPNNDIPERMQGVFVPPDELRQIVQAIKKYSYDSRAFDLKFTISEEIFQATDAGSCGADTLRPIVPKSSFSDRRFAEILMWAISQDIISTNQLKGRFHMSWDKAKQQVAKLEELGVVERIDANVARHVIPMERCDIPNDMTEFLRQHGFSEDDLCCALAARNRRR